MASSERISQILPTVKCSDCGRDVLIRRLGDHLCTSQPPVPPLPIIPAMKDKFKPQINHPPISPLQSPNSGFKYNHNQPYNNSYSNNTGGAVTPPYAMTKDRPLMKDVYTDDTYADDFYKSTSTVDLPRNNMNSPSSPVSFRNHNESNSELNTRYEGTRKQSLGNIYNQQKSSYSTPTSNSSGALDNLMADLMNSMNDDIHLSSSPIPTSTKHNSNHCAVCHEEFDYRDVVKQAGQKCYHKTCFVCRLCSTPFDQRSTHHEYEGELYCERDFHVVKNRIMCGACDKTISPSTAPIKALGRFYHPGHIKCYHCLCPIDGTTGWKEYQGRVYCRSDFKSLFLPKCKSCHGTIEKNAVSAMDGKLKGKWHLECFGCHTCHRPFPDNTFYVFDDLPYCKRHYHQLNNSLCRECSEPIEGQCAQTNENWRFHPRCFGCTVCHHPIIDTYYMYDRRIYCETHIRQLQRQKNIRAEKRKTQFGQI